jgi:hypothetical protein
MIIGIGTKIINIRTPKGLAATPTPPPPPPQQFFMELEDGSGFMELEPSTDLMLQESAP